MDRNPFFVLTAFRLSRSKLCGSEALCVLQFVTEPRPLGSQSVTILQKPTSKTFRLQASTLNCSGLPEIADAAARAANGIR
jgi:hypothetical protein